MSDAGPRKYLLDAHTLIWALREPERLSAGARDAILEGELFLSVVSYWEVTIKSMKGGIDVGDTHTWWTGALGQLAARTLLLLPSHVGALRNLPPIHKDPFDRMLIAQAMEEGMTLVTADAEIAQYASESLRVIR